MSTLADFFKEQLKENIQFEKEFTVYFDAFNKKLKMKVIAFTEEEAKQIVLKSVKFIKIEVEKNGYNDFAQSINTASNIMFPKDKN